MCEICGLERPSCGPWRFKEIRWKSVCGECKINMALTDPEFVARVLRDFISSQPVK